MALLHVIALLSMIYMSTCLESDECSKHGLFPGFAEHRETPPTAMVTIILYADVQTACDAGAHCAMACFNYSSQWNFFEIRWESMFWLYLAL